MARLPSIVMLVLLLGAIPQATAETTQEVQTLSVLGGVRVKGDVGLWILPSAEDSGTFVLKADRLTLTYDQNWLAAGFLVDRPTRLYFRNGTPEPGNTHTEVNVTLNGNAWMDDGFLAITPIEGRPPPQVAFAADNLVAQVESRPCVSDPGHLVITKCWETGAEGRLVATRPTAPLMLSGDFRMRIWGWEGGGSFNEGYKGSFWTGTAPWAGGAEGLAQFDWHDVEAYSATLMLEMAQDGVGEVYSSSAQLSTDRAAVVAFDGGGDAAGTSPTTLDLAFADQAMQATWQPGETPRSGWGTGWPVVAGAIAILAAIVAAATFLLLRNRDPILQALYARNPRLAAELALAAAPSRNREESVVRAVAFIRAGQYDDAERELDAYALPEADLKFLRACICAKQGRDDEARRLLADSFRLQPAYELEMRFNADLARVMGLGPEGYT